MRPGDSETGGAFLAMQWSTSASNAAQLQPAWRADPAKRALDVGLSLLALGLLSPLMLIAGLMVRLSSPGPVLMRQVRIGQHEQPFTMLKFRTMRSDADDRLTREINSRELRGERAPDCADGVFKQKDDPRVTPVGRWLRRFSIDELPQLFNVLRGDMSLVGPRPHFQWEVELFKPEQRRRHECLPGITGLWQVSGRNRLSPLEMLELDLEYLRSRSFGLDLRILARTPVAVLFDRSVR